MHDIVIIGGGLTGATAALALKTRNPELNIAVIEPFHASDNSQPSFDDRSIAVAIESFKYLSSLGLINANDRFASAIQQVFVSDRGHFGKTQLSSDEYDCEALGYVVEVKQWGRALHTKMQQLGIALFCPDKVIEYTQKTDSISLLLQSDQTITTQLMLIADGAHSQTLSPLKINTMTVDYEQVALIANVEVAKNHHNHAFERFTNSGPMALLPMTNNRYSLAWCVKPELRDELLALEDSAFITRLQNEFGYRAGLFTKVGTRQAYPLKVGKPDRLIHHRVAILGNAAHIVHPIAGQGFNLALRDIMLLDKLISQAVKQKEDIGNVRLLNQYHAQRNRDIDSVLWLTDALVRGFSNDNRAFALTRSLILTAMTKCKVLKAPLAKQLMGNVG